MIQAGISPASTRSQRAPINSMVRAFDQIHLPLAAAEEKPVRTPAIPASPTPSEFRVVGGKAVQAVQASSSDRLVRVNGGILAFMLPSGLVTQHDLGFVEAQQFDLGQTWAPTIAAAWAFFLCRLVRGLLLVSSIALWRVLG